MAMDVSLQVRLREVLDEILGVAREVEATGGSEEDLKVRVEAILREKVWSKLGVPAPRYEYKIGSGAYARSYRRVDALYGLAVFEYKRPGVLRTKERDEAVKKLVEEYIPGLVKESWVKALIGRAKERGLSPRIIGIIFDGYGVVFVEYHIETGKFSVDPPTGFYDLTSESGVDYLRRIVRSVMATYKKKIDARVLASDFGYASSIAKRAVRTFYYKLAQPRTEKTKALFEEWRKTVSQAYPVSGEDLRRIAELYGFTGRELREVDGVRLFYAIQTYYALILKLLAAEVAARFHDSAASIYVENLVKAMSDLERLRRELEFLESGMVYTWYGIRNFLEGELFSWYLNEWDEEVSDVVRDIVEELSEYDVEALTLDPSTARDVFKLLYEELVPRKEVRQKLGIYSTPDWLAELVLDELGLSVEKMLEMKGKGKDPLDLRVLDPGVGTGTFLSLYIQRLGRYLREHYGFVPHKVAREALRKITRNVVGFDIDSLAVLTARTNYLIALAVTGLLEHKGDEAIEIPIYMANSVVTAEELKDKIMVTANGETVVIEAVKIDTAKGIFRIPLRLVATGVILELLSELREPLRHGYEFNHKTVRTIIERYTERYGLSKAEIKLIEELYDSLLTLKKKGVDDVWIPVIKSHIVSTLYKNYFDVVIGNPPWIAYRYIANPDYQARVKSLIKDRYGLVRDEHLITHMEMATLFFVRSLDLYLRDGGLIGFVMPRSIFSADQHDNFRRGSVSNASYEVLKIIDAEGVKPLFYVPTCAIIARKGGKTKYPLEAIVVKGKLPEDKHKVIQLREALARNHLEIDKDKQLHLNQVGARSYLAYEKIMFHGKRSDYYNMFYQGATIVPQPCWLVEVIDYSDPSFVVVKTARRAKVRGKVKAEIGPLPVEREFIYGVITSAEVLPFCNLPPNTAVLPIIPAKTKYVIITRGKARSMGYLHLAKWLEEAEKIWDKVRGEKRVNLYEWLDYQNKLTRQNPNARYKVVYARSGEHITSCVLCTTSDIKVQNVSLKGIILNDMVNYFDTNSEAEAHYLAAILNSNIINEYIRSMIVKGAFGGRHIHKKPLELPIPKFDPNDPIHRRLAELGKKANERACKLLSDLLIMLDYNRKIKERGTLVPQEVARLRQAIRVHLREILNEIDMLVRELLSGSVKPISEDSAKSSKRESSLELKGARRLTLDAWIRSDEK